MHALCRLAGEFHAQGRKVLIFAPDAALAAEIDRQLWIQPATGFLPHCHCGDTLAAETPILIGARLEDDAPHDVLINLNGELPPAFARYEQLIEIVGAAEEDRAPARERFRFYRERGYAITAHDLTPS